MVLKETYNMASGYAIPKIGFGTWLIRDDDEACEAVKTAIGVGYRHIDSAEAYDNEEGVGRGIRQSGLKREDVFLTTKLRAELKTYKEAARAIDLSLKKLSTDYIDLMIIHCPQPWDKRFQSPRSYDEGNREAWLALEDASRAGKIRTIGVSNFDEEDLENILEIASVPVSVNQIKTHIGVTPYGLIDFCAEKGILCEAYSPLAHWRIKNPEIIQSYADRYGVSFARLCIRYTLQLGMVTLPKTTKRERMTENADVDFEISAEDMEKLRKLSINGDYELVV
ncbi:MAG: aldo/keto reductase [Clostridia bacterium]|nr:aldo/keto reductase [Clostridia bacterium]